MRRDEWYDFRHVRPDLNVLLFVDENSYEGGRMGPQHPIAWCQNVGKGRSFYTAMGHTKASYTEAKFVRHVREGLFWAAGSDPEMRERRGDVLLTRGAQIFATSCVACHGPKGEGVPGGEHEGPLGPSLRESKIARASRSGLLRAQLRGVTTPPQDREYTGQMAFFPAYDDGWHAAVASHVRHAILGLPRGTALTLPREAARARAATAAVQHGFERSELLGDGLRAVYPKPTPHVESTELASGLTARPLLGDPRALLWSGALPRAGKARTIHDHVLPDTPAAHSWLVTGFWKLKGPAQLELATSDASLRFWRIGDLHFPAGSGKIRVHLEPGCYDVSFLAAGTGPFLSLDAELGATLPTVRSARTR